MTSNLSKNIQQHKIYTEHLFLYLHHHRKIISSLWNNTADFWGFLYILCWGAPEAFPGCNSVYCSLKGKRRNERLCDALEQHVKKLVFLNLSFNIYFTFSVDGFGPNDQNSLWVRTIVHSYDIAADAPSFWQYVTNSEAFTKAVALSGQGSHTVWPMTNETATYCPS